MAEQIIQTGLNSIIGKRYLDYAIYVAKGRALPSVFDGCKPVQRRILFDMQELGLFHNKPYKKSARVVGDVLGKYFAVLSRYYRRLRIIRTELSGDVVK